jgi:hypothetical protein
MIVILFLTTVEEGQTNIRRFERVGSIIHRNDHIELLGIAGSRVGWFPVDDVAHFQVIPR